MEVVLRSIVLWLFAWLLLRAMGRRVVSSNQPFDLIVIVVIGNLLQQGALPDDFSVTGSMLAVGTFGLMTVAFSYASYRFGFLRPSLEGKPVVIVENGRPLDDNLRRERISLHGLLTAAREEGLDSLERVRWAVLETNGEISFVLED